ncbi:MAG: hypothetical protein Q9180_008027, partial [Flavoplaca navasiana]
PPDKKWSVVAAQNTAVDRTCSILLTSKTLMVIRAHPEALEFGEMFKSAQKQAQGVLLPADPESDAESESDGEEMTLPAAETDPVPSEIPGPEPDPRENDDWNVIPDDAPNEYTQSILNQCENVLKIRGLITKISDDRLKLISNSLYAWVLRFAGLLDCPFVRNEFEKNPAIEFSNVHNLAKSQYLNNSQEKAFKKLFAEIAVTVLKKAEVVCTTPVQVGNKNFDELTFDGVIVDEAGVVTESEWD